ncbi:hypothetical protein ACFL29_01585 [Patescibacteria group bacterium]
MAIVGRLSDEQLQAALKAKKEERKKREENWKRREHARDAKKRLVQNMDEESLNRVTSRLIEEKKAAAREALSRRKKDGKFVSRKAQKEAAKRADNLERRGF